MTFNDFNLKPELIEGLQYMGFKTATPIQEKAIPVILNNQDLIACAQTGTGKTAAFLLPIINKLIENPSDTTNTLVVVPTRELAIQIDEAMQGFAYFTGVSSLAIYGGGTGAAFDQERHALTEGANIIIATPGRLISHLNLGYVKFDNVKHLVLDEADRMLDMGFNDDINKIISFLPQNFQAIMFSATMPLKMRALAKKILKNPFELNIAISKPAAGVTQGAYVVFNEQKLPLLKNLLQGSTLASIIVFSSRKETVKELERELARMKMNVASIHSDLDQDVRIEVLRRYKNKTLQILIATDVMSRGIDIDSIGLVINYDVPNDAEDYIHRIGRTARAETTGTGLSFINPADQKKFRKIEDLIGEEINKLPVPESLGPCPAYEPEKQMDKPKKKFFKKKPFKKP